MSGLRPMLATDLIKFADCNLDPLTETYNVSFYLEYLAKWPYMCHVMESDLGLIEGYILGKLETSPPPNMPTATPYSPDTNKNPHYLPWHGHITALTVAPEARRIGHARRLTEALERQADEAEAWFVDLYVRKDNERAVDMYRGMGYSVFRKVKDYYADGCDAYDMRKAMTRDKDKKHIREKGEEVEVDPSEVW